MAIRYIVKGNKQTIAHYAAHEFGYRAAVEMVRKSRESVVPGARYFGADRDGRFRSRKKAEAFAHRVNAAAAHMAGRLGRTTWYVPVVCCEEGRRPWRARCD